MTRAVFQESLGVCDRSDSRRGEQPLRDYQCVREAAAGLPQLHVRSRKTQTISNQGNVRRREARRGRGVPDDIIEIARFDLRFIERGSESSGRQIGIGMSWARRLVAFLKVATNVSRFDPEPIRQPGSSTPNINAEALSEQGQQIRGRYRRPGQGGSHAENPKFSLIVPEP